jgi:hypothetical protein
MNATHQTIRMNRRPVFLRFLSFLLFIALLSGCACPRRGALATHVQEHFSGRADGLVWRERWEDSERGGGVFLFTDPNVQSMYVTHTNQAALGGGSVFTAGSLTLVLDTNTAAIIGAGGTAIGNVIGASVKAAVK